VENLVVVSPEQPDQERMLKMATHKAAHLIHRLHLVDNTAEAAAPYHFIVGTTARIGKHRIAPEPLCPKDLMNKLVPLAQGHRVALMFGPESSGLSNEDLDLCQYTSTIPTADFSSLNLAQAVAIHCYELFMAAQQEALSQEQPAEAPSLYANSYELEGMYAHIEQALRAITFLRHSNTVYWMRTIRQFLSRTRIRKKEASLIRGVCRKFLWYQKQEGQDQR
jgi:tRNA/rRNA methyltransferase